MNPRNRCEYVNFKNVSIAYTQTTNFRLINCPFKIQSVYFIELQKVVVLGKKTLVLRNYIEPAILISSKFSSTM